MTRKIAPYNFTTIFLHWVMAILIIGLFILGEYMVDLTYYDSWYNSAPNWHRSLGVITFLLLIIRVIWRWLNQQAEGIGKPWEQRIAKIVHQLFYILTFAIVISGYLITTADGQAVSVFNWFDIPATFYGYENQEDIVGEAHELLTNLLIILVILHSLAALKHHFINRDATLIRMLRVK